MGDRRVSSANYLLETIVASLDDAREAAAGGADRLELCSALALGGLTPSLGTLRSIRQEIGLSLMCMIRPREGGMAYSEAEFTTMLADAELALEAGADGLVFGFLDSSGEVETARTRRMVRLAEQASGPERRIEAVFHRAFDVTRRPEIAVKQLIDLGVTRVLTSGRAPTAKEGIGQIRRMVDISAGRIEILPGGAITDKDVRQILREAGVNQVHMYLTEVREDTSTTANPRIHFGAHVPQSELEYHTVSRSRVRRIRDLLDED